MSYPTKDREHLARLQRMRRALLRRVDYMPSPHALPVIEARRTQERPGSVAATNSAVINAIVAEWAAMTGMGTTVVRTSDPERSARMRANDSQDAHPELMQPSRARARMNPKAVRRCVTSTRACVCVRTGHSCAPMSG